MKKRLPNILSNRLATVSLMRNGLTIEVMGVPASDAAVVAKSMLDAMRGLVAAGYDELIQDHDALHSDSFTQPEEMDDAEYKIAPESRSSRSKLGFQ